MGNVRNSSAEQLGCVMSDAVPAGPGFQTARTLLAYGGLSLPLSLAGLPILTYLPAFYAQELGLSAAVVGLVFLCARLWDGVSNILVGWLSDQSTSAFGRRKPWVLLGAPFLIGSTWFLCNPPPHASPMYLAVWVMLFYTSWAVMSVPYVSWGAELATDYAERSRVASFRETFTMLGNLFFAAAPIAFLAGGASLRSVLLLLSLTVVLMIPIAVAPIGLWVRDLAPKRTEQTEPLNELLLVAKDRVLARFVAGALLFAVGDGVVNSLLVFFFGVGLKLSTGMLFWALFILYISTLCAVPFTLRIAQRVEKHRLLAAAVALQVVLYCIFAMIPERNFALVAALEVGLGIANGALLILPTSILADIIDHGDVKSGKRPSGAYVAVYCLFSKVGLALGVGLGFGLLAVVGYDPDAQYHTATDVAHIRLLAFGLPCILQIPAVYLYLTHPITRQIQMRFQEQIRMRSQVSPGLP
jgi:glycoside/pentoside/hexuronide:cation symporter, GPH family